MPEFEYHVLKPLRVDLGAGELETLQPHHVLSEDDVASWGRSVDALIDHGKLARLPKRVEEPSDFSDEDLLAELEQRGLHTATVEQTAEIPEGARVFTAEDGDEIASQGVAAVRKPNPVHLWIQDEPFAVETDSGVMVGESGGFVAHDPQSGQVWPVSADYVELHYEPAEAVEASGDDEHETEPAPIGDAEGAGDGLGEPDAGQGDEQGETPPQDGDGLDELTKAQLKQIAADESIELPAGARANAAIIEAIRAARAAKNETAAE